VNRTVRPDVERIDDKLFGVREPDGASDGGDFEIGDWLRHVHCGPCGKMLPMLHFVIYDLFWGFQTSFCRSRRRGTQHAPRATPSNKLSANQNLGLG
jgi:hypothetical protein